jgi:hypothetical protein
MNPCTCHVSGLWNTSAVCPECGGVFGADHQARHDLLLLRSVAPAVLPADQAVAVMSDCLYLSTAVQAGPPENKNTDVAADARELLGLIGETESLSGLSAATLGLAAVLPPREVLAAVYLWADHPGVANSAGSSSHTVFSHQSSTLRTYEVTTAAVLLALSAPVDSAFDKLATPIARALADRCVDAGLSAPLRVSIDSLRRALDHDPLRAEMDLAACDPGRNTTVSILGQVLAHRRLGNHDEAAAFHHLLVGSGCFLDAFSYGACSASMWGLEPTGTCPNVTSTAGTGL